MLVLQRKLLSGGDKTNVPLQGQMVYCPKGVNMVFENVLVAIMSVIVFAATGFGWWYEEFGPNEEEKGK